MTYHSKVRHANDGASSILIIGIDPGTTSFKVAILIVEEVWENQGTPKLVQAPNAHVTVLADFPGDHRVALNHTSTSLIYDSHDFKLSKWGHLATYFQTHDSFDPNYLVNHWKLAIHKSSSPAACRLREALEAVARRLNKRPESFIEDFFFALRSYLFESDDSVLLNNLSRPLSYFKYVDVVIAVPPGWPRHEHRIFSHAATIGLGNMPNLRVCTVSETECVLRSWSLLQTHQDWIEFGEIVILLDLGGGTACISAFRYEAAADGAGRWAHMESHSLSAGSEMVTEEFVKDVQERLKGIKGLPDISQSIYRARVAFEQKKKEVGEAEVDYWSLPIKGLKPNINKEFGKDRMYFSKERLESYFAPSQNLLFAKFHEVSHRIAQTHGKPRGCIVSGAYAKNIIFRKRFKAENSLDMEIFYPQPVAELVVRGACLARVQGDFRQFSGSRYSIGIKVYILWKEAKKSCPAAHHRSFYSRKFAGDPKDYYPAISWPIKKGDAVDIDHEVNDSLTIRYFEPDEPIQFTDTVFISESHPGPAKYSVLKYNTADPAMWKQNRRDLRERNIVVEATEVTWNINQTEERKANGLRGPYERSALPEDPKDDRVVKRRFLKYKYYFRISQTDCEISIKAFFAKQKSQKIVVRTSPIIVLDGGEYGSVALPEEYSNFANQDGDGEDSANDAEVDQQTFQQSGGRNGEVQNHISYPEEIRIYDTESDPYLSHWQNHTTLGVGNDSIDDQVNESMSEAPSTVTTRLEAKKRRYEACRPKRAKQARITARTLREIAAAAGEIVHVNPRTSVAEDNQDPRSGTRSVFRQYEPALEDLGGSNMIGHPGIPYGPKPTYRMRNSTSRASSALPNQVIDMHSAANPESDDSSGEYNPRNKSRHRF